MKWCIKRGDEYLSGISRHGWLRTADQQRLAVRWDNRIHAQDFAEIISGDARVVRLRPPVDKSEDKG